MSTQDDTVRAFVAVEIPEAGKTFLETILADLRRTRADVRWVRPAGIHITLKFLGQIPLELVGVLEKDLSALFAEHRPFELTIQGLGAFPNLAKPRVVWAGIRDTSGTLSLMANRVETALESLGFEKEKRKFSPHLTLGRTKSGSGINELVDAIRQGLDVTGPTFVSREAILIQSILKPSGAEYRAMCRFALSST